MEGYSEDMFELEVAVARARAAGEDERAVDLGRRLASLGIVDCGVCGGMISFHSSDNWVHQDQGLDHDARPNRIGFEWPQGVPQLGGRASR